MGCIYENFDGECTLWDDSVESLGCDEKGYCICSDDPDPSIMCGNYESDWSCSECGADLNMEECDCEAWD